MAAGLPVLCSIHAIAKEMIRPGKNGYLFDPLNEPELLETIITLFENQHRWGEMGRYGQTIVSKEYSAQVSTTAMARGIQKILGNKTTAQSF
jgi:glycosyltransferase involved in cell wall biosynthesis